MTAANLNILKKQFTGRAVTIDAQRPELARMAHWRGRVIDVNCNGLALVQFEGADQGWYEIEPEYLNVAENAA